MIGFILDYWLYLLIAGGAIVGIGAAAYLLHNWRVALAAAPIIISILSLGRAFSAGEKKAKERQELLTQKAIKQVQDTKEEVDRMSNSQVDLELQKWIRK